MPSQGGPAGALHRRGKDVLRRPNRFDVCPVGPYTSETTAGAVQVSTSTVEGRVYCRDVGPTTRGPEGGAEDPARMVLSGFPLHSLFLRQGGERAAPPQPGYAARFVLDGDWCVLTASTEADRYF